MRIVFGIGNYSFGYGMPNVVLGLARELQNRGNDVSILTGKSNMVSPVPVYRSGYNEALKHAYIVKTLRTLLGLKPDIFHSHYYPMDFCGALVSSGIKHVLHVHGIIKRNLRVSKKAALECFRSSLTESIGIKFSSKIITISNFLKSDILNKYRLSPQEIEVIYPSVDLGMYSPDNRCNLLRRASGNGINLLSVSAISERKGQHLLIEAMSIIARKFPKTRLFLVGRIGEEDASYLERLRRSIKKYGLERNVIIKGFVPTPFMPSFYAQTNVFVTGTMWEGFGMPIAEAMASGIPVVAFDTASMHELIADGITGLKAPAFDTGIFADLVMRLIQDSKLRAEMGRNGRSLAEEKFEIKRAVNRLSTIYESVSESFDN